jgi:hypothetical protein
MIIELGNIHAKWKLLIESTCMLPANGNVTMWIGTWSGMCRCATNKGETNCMEGTGIAKLIVMEGGDCETNNCQNRPWGLHQATLLKDSSQLCDPVLGPDL